MVFSLTERVEHPTSIEYRSVGFWKHQQQSICHWPERTFDFASTNTFFLPTLLLENMYLYNISLRCWSYWLTVLFYCLCFFDSWEITSEIHNNLECRTNSTYQWLGAFDWQICWKSKFRLLQIKNNNLQMKHQKLKWYFMFFLDHTLRWR
jgi:hypothetical protein